MGMGQAVEWSPTVNTAVYADGQVLGTGNPYTLKMPEFAGASMILQSVLVRDRANQKIGIDFLFFTETPTGTYTDRTAFVIADADRSRYIGKFSIIAADYTTLATGFAEATKDQIAKAIAKASGETAGVLRMIAIIRGAADYVAATDLSARFTFLNGDRQ